MTVQNRFCLSPDNRSQQSSMGWSLSLSVLLGCMMVLSGCEAPGGSLPGGGRPAGPPPIASQRPKPVAPVKAMSPTQAQAPDAVTDTPAESPASDASSQADASPSATLASLAMPLEEMYQAGNRVMLAAEILMAKANPFLSRLPALVPGMTPSDLLADTPVDSGMPVEMVDPFENLALLGIVYNAASPIALLSVQGGETQTQLVKAGDVLMMDGQQIKVGKVHPDSVELSLLGPSPEQRTLSLPSIISYSGRGAEAPSGGDMAGSAGFSNLSRLGSTSAAQVVLQEP